MRLRAGRFDLSLDRPLVMGIVNLTPDSFSDQGRHWGPRAAIEHAQKLIEAGADLIDLGAESSRPGAQPVSAAEEIDRLMPVLEALVPTGCPLSVDTTKPVVMRAVIDAGAVMINDIQALREPGALDLIATSGAAVCLMHMQGEPRTMQRAPHYDDVVREVGAFLRERADACLAAGVERTRIVVDPGYGFGKTVDHNLTLLAQQAQLADCGFALLAGLSRKSTIGAVTGRAVDDRLPGSLAAALIAVQHGARILRVHDVAATRDVLALWAATEEHARTRH